jgi:hypothetical protein
VPEGAELMIELADKLAPPSQIWFGLALVAPLAFLLIALGVCAREFQHRRSSKLRLVT